MKSQFTENTKEDFHHKLENLLSKLDKMVEAIKSESEEDRSWIPQAVESRSSWGKLQDAVNEAGESVVRFGKAVVDAGSSVIEAGVDGVKKIGGFIGDGVKGIGSAFSSLLPW